jgi:hypothetical protein
MWKNSHRYLEHCLYFDLPVCILLWLKKIKAKTFRFAFVYLRFRRFPFVLLVEVIHVIGINFYVTLEELHCSEILI